MSASINHSCHRYPHVHWLHLRLAPPPRSSHFPYTTLFRSALPKNIRTASARWFCAIRRPASTRAAPRCWTSAPPLPHAKRSEEHTSELQSRRELVWGLVLEKKNTLIYNTTCHSGALSIANR